jgi:hypothetical protein
VSFDITNCCNQSGITFGYYKSDRDTIAWIIVLLHILNTRVMLALQALLARNGRSQGREKPNYSMAGT